MSEKQDEQLGCTAVVMPSWDQLSHSFAQLSPECRIEVLVKTGICPRPIRDLTWGIELQLLKYNRAKWPIVMKEIELR